VRRFLSLFTQNEFSGRVNLMKILKRAKELTLKGIPLPCSEPLLFFLQNKVTIDTLMLKL
jgi:hypothetical protein